MVQVHHGRKTRKAHSSDRFHAEWLAHEAAVAEEDRTLESIEAEEEELDEIPDDDKGVVVKVIA